MAVLCVNGEGKDYTVGVLWRVTRISLLILLGSHIGTLILPYPGAGGNLGGGGCSCPGRWMEERRHQQVG